MKHLLRVISSTTAAVLSLASLLTLGLTGVAHAAAQTCTWTGTTDNKFSTATNWTNCGGGVPQNGDSISLDSTALTADKTLTQDIAGLAVGGITIVNTTPAGTMTYGYVINGDIHVAGNITVASSLTLVGTVTLDADTVVAGTGFLSLNNAATTLAVGTHSVTLAGSSYWDLGKVTGTGSVVYDGGDDLSTLPDLTGFTGSILVKKSVMYFYKDAFSATSAITVSPGAAILTCGFDGGSVANPLTIGGDGVGFGAIAMMAGCRSGGGGRGPTAFEPAASVTWTGPITLTANTTVGGTGEMKVTGTLSGNYALAMKSGELGKLTIAASTNTSATQNGTTASALKTMELKDTTGQLTEQIRANTIGVLTGKYADIYVSGGGLLKGNGGTITGRLTVFDKGIVAPGMSPGCITSDTLQLDGEYQFELGGKEPCTGYDQLKVTGTSADSVNIGATAVLKVTRLGDFTPAKDDTFVIIDQAGSQAVKGTFSGLAEGATIDVDGVTYKISYKGGDGNDVVLVAQVVQAPTVPDTGFALVAAHPAITLAATAAVAGGMIALARASRKFAPARTKIRR